jgi:hypothetical protein
MSHRKFCSCTCAIALDFLFQIKKTGIVDDVVVFNTFFIMYFSYLLRTTPTPVRASRARWVRV